MKNVVFLNFSTFEKKGGIETVNKTVIYILTKLSLQKPFNFKIHSLLDRFCEEKYCNISMFNFYNGSKIKFIFNSIFKSLNCQILILSHINLTPIALVIKIFNPKMKIILFCHGIEVWKKIPYLKLKFINHFIAVSEFTKTKLIFYNKINFKKITVIHNTLEPFFIFKEIGNLNLNSEYKIITLTRASFEEQYKGYDIVIEIINELSRIIPNLKYFLAGPIDDKEKLRLIDLVKKNKVENIVNILGLLPSNELEKFYTNADLFVMPSRNEGFGIVFIESLACGTRIITGNIDGSREIVKNKNIGYSIDLSDKKYLINAILDDYNKKLNNTRPNKNDVKLEFKKHFSFEIYENKFLTFFNSLS